MQQDGKSAPGNTLRQIASINKRDATDVVHAEDAVVDPLEFFTPATSHADVASYAKAQARANVPLTRLAALARDARSETLGWAVFPVLIAAALLWIAHDTVHVDRLILLALGVAALLGGVNLLRGAALAAQDRSLSALFTTSNPARIGAGLLMVGAILGYVAARHVSGGLFALGVLGVALAALYALLPLFLKALPGEELLPAAVLGPLLFFFALATQLAPTVATTLTIIKGHRIAVPNVAPSVTSVPGAWSIGLALGAFVLAALLANRLGHPTRPAGQGTLSMVGAATLRMLFLASLLAAYAIIVLAGLRHGGIHAVLAVLLSVPMAVLPLTSALRATNRTALAALLPQTRRAFLWFTLWLLAGLVLGGIYLHAMTVLHTVLTK